MATPFCVLKPLLDLVLIDKNVITFLSIFLSIGITQSNRIALYTYISEIA